MLRHLLELASRGVVLKRRLPAGFGGHEILVTPDASLKFWRRDLTRTDPFLLRMAEQLAGRGTVWDVGANVGLFSFASAALGSPVLAIEPDPVLAPLIRRSAALNGLAVEVLRVAVSDRTGEAEFHIAERGRATNHLGPAISTQTGGTRQTVPVETITLDSLLSRFTPPKVLKIDVEGAEGAALLGARCLLRDVRPVVLVEVAAETRNEVTALLKEHSYRLTNAETSQPVDEAAWNTLALPG